MTTIALIDDHLIVRSGFAQLLNLEPDFQVVAEFGSGREALAGLVPVDTDGRLFSWTYAQAAYRMRQATRAAGWPGSWRGFHAARKYGGTRLYGRVKDFTRVSLFLGHASVGITCNRYNHFFYGGD